MRLRVSGSKEGWGFAGRRSGCDPRSGSVDGVWGLAFQALVFTWRVGGLSNWLFSGLISTINPIRAPFRVLISLLTTYLLSPPTLQVGESRVSEMKATVANADKSTRWGTTT